MTEAWIRTPGWSVLLEADGRPVEVHVPERPATDAEEAALRVQIEHALDAWIGWEDAWRREGEQYRRYVDLLGAQPSHRLHFSPDGGQAAMWLLLVDAVDAERAVAWTREEWFSSGSRDGGVWTREADGWRCAGVSTPGGVSGALSVEPITQARPVSLRRRR